MGSASARANVFRKHGLSCHYGCGTPAATLDHIVPRSAGGPSAQWNLVPACRECNALKASLRGVCVCFHCIAAEQRFADHPQARRVVVEKPPVRRRSKSQRAWDKAMGISVHPVGVCPVTMSGEHQVGQGATHLYCIRCYEVLAA